MYNRANLATSAERDLHSNPFAILVYGLNQKEHTIQRKESKEQESHMYISSLTDLVRLVYSSALVFVYDFVLMPLPLAHTSPSEASKQQNTN